MWRSSIRASNRGKLFSGVDCSNCRLSSRPFSFTNKRRSASSRSDGRLFCPLPEKARDLGRGSRLNTKAFTTRIARAGYMRISHKLWGVGLLTLSCLCGIGLWCWWPEHPLITKLLYGTWQHPTCAQPGRAVFRMENHLSTPVVIRPRLIEEQQETGWQMSRVAPHVEIVGTPGITMEWTIPARATNAFLCNVPTCGRSYRLILECYPQDQSASRVTAALRDRLAHWIFLTAPKVPSAGPNIRSVSLGRMKTICGVKGGVWLVTESFCATPPSSPLQVGNSPLVVTGTIGNNSPLPISLMAK